MIVHHAPNQCMILKTIPFVDDFVDLFLGISSPFFYLRSDGMQNRYSFIPFFWSSRDDAFFVHDIPKKHICFTFLHIRFPIMSQASYRLAYAASRSFVKWRLAIGRFLSKESPRCNWRDGGFPLIIGTLFTQRREGSTFCGVPTISLFGLVLSYF